MELIIDYYLFIKVGFIILTAVLSAFFSGITIGAWTDDDWYTMRALILITVLTVAAAIILVRNSTVSTLKFIKQVHKGGTVTEVRDDINRLSGYRVDIKVEQKVPQGIPNK